MVTALELSGILGKGIHYSWYTFDCTESLANTNVYVVTKLVLKWSTIKTSFPLPTDCSFVISDATEQDLNAELFLTRPSFSSS